MGNFESNKSEYHNNQYKDYQDYTDDERSVVERNQS